MTGVDRLIAALTLAQKGMTDYHLDRPTVCADETMTLCSDPSRFTSAEIAHMERLGFIVHEEWECFISHEFGNA